MLKGAKRRCEKHGIPFNIGIEDIPIPDRCPVLGLQLEPTPHGAGRRDNAPSIERIDPDLGYVKGNVLVISWRANKIKSDATVEELRRVYEWAAFLEQVPPAPLQPAPPPQDEEWED